MGWLRKQAPNWLKVKAIEQLQQTLILNKHIPSGSRKQTQKLKQNEFFASHTRETSPDHLFLFC